MTDKLIYNLLDADSFNLRLNENIPKFKLIKELLSHNQIPFETWSPEEELALEVFEMGFAANCRFQDVYLLAYILKKFGLERIYPSRKQDTKIEVGTYLHQVPRMRKFALAEPLSIDSFLLIDPKTITQTAIDSFFENHFSDENNEDGYDTKPGEDDYNDQDYHNNYSDDKVEMGDCDYDPMKPAHDPNENPWIEVFGPGDEAETAYWNTD